MKYLTLYFLIPGEALSSPCVIHQQVNGHEIGGNKLDHLGRRTAAIHELH